MGIKAFGRPHTHAAAAVFLNKIGLRKKKIKRLAGPGPYRIKKDRAPASTMMRMWAIVSFRRARSFFYLFF